MSGKGDTDMDEMSEQAAPQDDPNREVPEVHPEQQQLPLEEQPDQPQEDGSPDSNLQTEQPDQPVPDAEPVQPAEPAEPAAE
jgi:hypothetical protein